MVGPLDRKFQPAGATRRSAVGLILGAPLLGACAGVQQSLGQFGSQEAAPVRPDRLSSRSRSALARSRSA